MSTSTVYWLSSPPKRCDTCGTAITDIFYDAKTSYGAWACMCPSCQTLGPGFDRLGQGHGQKYQLQPNGKWLKTAG